MEQKVAKLIQSLSSIGLDESAARLASVQSLYKTAFHDFSKEIQILEQLAQILDQLRELHLNEQLDADLKLPAFSIESGKQRTVKSEESLRGYTKQQILIGIENYLKTFTKNYMQARLPRLTYDEEKTYQQAIGAIEDLRKELSKTNSAVTKGISKQSIWSGLGKVLRTASMINLYTTIVQKEAPKIPTGVWSNLDLNQKLKELDFDLEEEMSYLDQEFMRENNISEKMFYYMVGSFRSKGSMAGYKQKMHDYVSDKIQTQASLNRKAADDEEEDEDETELDLSEAEEFLERKIPERKIAPDPEQQPGPGESEKGSEAEERHKIFRRLQEDPVDYRHVINKVTSSMSLVKYYTGKGKPYYYTPGEIFTAYSKHLLPLFREQYKSLLRSAAQVYTSIYQVQSVRNNLAQQLREVAGRLEMLDERNA